MSGTWRGAALVLLIAAGSIAPSALMRGASTDSVIAVAGRSALESRHSEVIAVLSPIPLDSLPARALFLLGNAYAGVNDFERSIAALRLCSNRVPGNAGYRFHLARLLLSSGMTKEAEREFATILTVDSSYAPARYHLGLLAFDRRDFAGALPHFLGVLALQPRDYLAYHSAGLCYANLDSIERAKAHFAASLGLNTRYIPALTQLASLYYRGSDYGQALRLYRRAIRDRPDDAEHWYNAGLCLEKLQDAQGARDAFREATRLDTTNSLYEAHLGQALFELGRFDSSAAAYARACALDEENPVLLLNLGLAYARAGSVQLAEKAFQEAIAAHEPEAVARAYNQLGALYYTHKRHRDALKAYQSALTFHPTNPDALFYKAVMLDHLRQHRQAKEAYRVYLKRAGNDASQSDKANVARKRIAEIQ